MNYFLMLTFHFYRFNIYYMYTQNISKYQIKLTNRYHTHQMTFGGSIAKIYLILYFTTVQNFMLFMKIKYTIFFLSKSCLTN